VREAKANRAGGWRIPAGDLEVLVISLLRGFLTDPAALLEVMGTEAHPSSRQRQWITRGHQVAEELGAHSPDKAQATLMALQCRVTIYSDRIEIAVSRDCTAALLAGASINLAVQPHNAVPAPHDAMTLRAPARLQRVGREMRMLLEGADKKAEADPSLLRLIARAHDIQGRLSQNTELTVHDVARQERVTAAYIYTLLRLPWLAPDITTAIVNGRQPQQLNAMTLMRKASRLPVNWAAQRTLLGF
jgi:hypothetical protein